MQLSELRDRSILILGLGREGLATKDFLRAAFPQKILGLADRLPLDALSDDARQSILDDPCVRLHLGPEQIGALSTYDVIVKGPGVPSSSRELQHALERGKLLTSHTAIFFANCPKLIVGVTGTKGKSTTASLIHQMLLAGGRETYLVGNIGQPALEFLLRAQERAAFVYELSSQQLEGLSLSPHVAVLLGLAPEHLDHHGSLAAYLEAKHNVTRHQTSADWLVYNAMSNLARDIAAKTKARLLPFGLACSSRPGCFVDEGYVVHADESGPERVIATEEVPLLGTFNLQNVLAAVAVGKILGVPTADIATTIRRFQPLEHRFELVGTHRGITFYNASIATVPEATIEHLNALDRVDTLLMGGHDRGLDFEDLGKHVIDRGTKTLILFPSTGRRIWTAVCRQCASKTALPKVFFVQDMREAVRLAYLNTEPGGVCLHSPAAASFGLFKDYRERGLVFKECVRELADAVEYGGS